MGKHIELTDGLRAGVQSRLIDWLIDWLNERTKERTNDSLIPIHFVATTLCLKKRPTFDLL